MTKKKTLSHGFIFNLFGSIVPIVVSLAVVPLYIHTIGISRYGIVTLCWVFLGYFEFLDFGMARASSNALAKLLPGDTCTRSRVLMTALYTNLFLGLAGGGIMDIAGHLLFMNFIKVPQNLMVEVVSAYPWMAGMLPFGMLGSVLKGAIEARERFFLSNALNIFANVGGQIVPLVCVCIWGPSLLVVIPALVATRMLYVVVSFLWVTKIERGIRVWTFDAVWLRRLFSYGSWVSVSNMLNPLLDTGSQVVIGSTLGAAAVANYSVPMNLAMRSQIVATALSRTLFPRMSRGTHEESVAMTRRAAGTLVYGFAVISGPAILFSATFLHLWIGPRFAAEAAIAAQILLFGAWANGVAFLPYNLLQAQGRPNITAKLSLVEILPFFVVLFEFIQWMGVAGAALAWTLRVTVNCLVLYLLSDCIRSEEIRLLPAIGMMLVCLVVAVFVPMTMIWSLIAAGLAVIAFALCAMKFDPLSRDIALKLIYKYKVR